MFYEVNTHCYSSLRYKLVKKGACLKVHFTCNAEILPLETHIFAYKLCNSAYVLIYKHFCTYNKCSCRFCGCSADFDENLSPARSVTRMN